MISIGALLGILALCALAYWLGYEHGHEWGRIEERYPTKKDTP